MTKTKYTEEEFIEAWNSSLSVAACARALGLVPVGGNYKTLNTKAKKLSLSKDHMTGQGWNAGDRFKPISTAQPIETYLVEGRACSTSSFKKRLIKEGLLEEKCSECGILEWQGKKLSLHLDHINGVNDDNRIENLRLLCPNCHSLTDTYCGKNKQAGVAKLARRRGLKSPRSLETYHAGSNPVTRTCVDCQAPCLGLQCKACYSTNNRRREKIDWPAKEELLARLAESNYSKLAKELGVSDNAIRKRIKKFSDNGV